MIEDMIRELDNSPSPLVDAEETPVSSSLVDAEETLVSSPDWEEVSGYLESNEWPQAVSPCQIVEEDSEKDKEERAEGIVQVLLPPLLGKRFLDFGCGEGHIAKNASKEASLSVGYDAFKSENSRLVWEDTHDYCLLTTDFKRVKEMGPYEVVLIYDVLDHARGAEPSEILSKAAEVLAEGGKIYLRCHPWCGRHGGHLYRKINKAFVHLVLSEEELRFLGVEPEHNTKVIRPLKYYHEAINAAGLVIQSQPEMDNQEVEDFFRDVPAIRKRILRHWDVEDWSADQPSFQMSQCFVDYVLKKK